MVLPRMAVMIWIAAQSPFLTGVLLPNPSVFHFATSPNKDTEHEQYNGHSSPPYSSSIKSNNLSIVNVANYVSVPIISNNFKLCEVRQNRILCSHKFRENLIEYEQTPVLLVTLLFLLYFIEQYSHFHTVNPTCIK